VLTAGGAASGVLPSTAPSTRKGGAASSRRQQQQQANKKAESQDLEYEETSEHQDDPEDRLSRRGPHAPAAAPYRDLPLPSPGHDGGALRTISPSKKGHNHHHLSSSPGGGGSHNSNNNPLDPHSHLGDPSITVSSKKTSDVVWLLACFLGIMASFVCYGLLLEYTTSGGRKLHELSFLFVTSGLYTLTAAAGRYVRDERPTTIPPARFAILGLTSMGSTFCSVRSLRYVIYPIQVLVSFFSFFFVVLVAALFIQEISSLRAASCSFGSPTSPVVFRFPLIR